MNARTYTVSDGTMTLFLEVAEEGGYNVTAPVDPELITQAETLEEAFENAYDARDLLSQVRAEMARAHVLSRSAQSSEASSLPGTSGIGSIVKPAVS